VGFPWATVVPYGRGGACLAALGIALAVDICPPSCPLQQPARDCRCASLARTQAAARARVTLPRASAPCVHHHRLPRPSSIGYRAASGVVEAVETVPACWTRMVNPAQRISRSATRVRVLNALQSVSLSSASDLRTMTCVWVLPRALAAGPQRRTTTAHPPASMRAASAATAPNRRPISVLRSRRQAAAGAGRRRRASTTAASAATAPPPEQRPVLESYAEWCTRAGIKHPSIRVAYFGEDVRGVEAVDGTTVHFRSPIVLLHARPPPCSSKLRAPSRVRVVGESPPARALKSDVVSFVSIRCAHTAGLRQLPVALSAHPQPMRLLV
jgi:hypothetical protein